MECGGKTWPGRPRLCTPSTASGRTIVPGSSTLSLVTAAPVSRTMGAARASVLGAKVTEEHTLT